VKNIFIVISVALIIGAGVVILITSVCEDDWCFVFPWQNRPLMQVSNFNECASLGNPVMESYPRQCRTSNGKTFVEDVGNELEKLDLIRVSTPRPNQEITSPLVIEGEARGMWFFEASFPVRVLDADGNELGVVPAQAQGEWMTTEFVPFKASLIFQKPETQTGTVIFEKDNPSGLPKNADELRMPVKFSSSTKDNLSQCIATGCSGQVCSDEEVITTCEYRPEYACYKSAVCERQINGECGWTQTVELSQCIEDAQK